MKRPKRKAVALSKKRVLGAAFCLLAVSAAQNQAFPYLFQEDTAAQPAAAQVSRQFDNPGLDYRNMVIPLEGHPGQIGFFETAHTLPAGEARGWIGTQQNSPDSASGTGNQLYFGGVDYGLSEDLEIGFVWQDFSDTLSKRIGGVFPRLEFQTLALRGKYRFHDSDRFSLAIEGSVESFVYKSSVFGTLTGPNRRNTIYSVALPMAYKMSPQVEFHVSPGVSVFPDSVGAADFFGTIPNISFGATWKPNQRWTAYGSVNVPFGPGGNTIDSTGAITNQPVWTVGGRYNLTPRLGLDAYVTNGFGATPATRILTFPPNGDTPIFGVRVNYIPGINSNYPSSYRGPLQPLTERAVRLQQDGFTLAAADTLSPGTLAFRGSYGTNDNFSGGVFLGLDQDVQVEVIYEDYADDGTLTPPRIPNKRPRLMFGGKLRFLDQNNGDPASVSVHALVSRDSTGLGALYLGAPVTYQATDRIAVSANPKLAAWGAERKLGLGLGVNYEVLDGLQMIAEVTPVNDGDPAVWAAGLRYDVPGTAISLDAHATNAIGRHGLGSMVAQSDPKFAIGAKIDFQVGWR